jgi:hypothetical protein
MMAATLEKKWKSKGGKEMILIPTFMPQPKIGFYTYSLEKKMEITARREAVLQVLRENDNLTLQDIAVKTNQDVRTTQAILTVLKKYDKVESLYTAQGKLWRII